MRAEILDALKAKKGEIEKSSWKRAVFERESADNLFLTSKVLMNFNFNICVHELKNYYILNLQTVCLKNFTYDRAIFSEHRQSIQNSYKLYLL